MCKPLVYRSKLTGRWTWDCEEHEASNPGRTWENALWEAQLHRWIKSSEGPLEEEDPIATATALGLAEAYNEEPLV